MFTGLVEDLGEVIGLARQGNVVNMTIRSSLDLSGESLGASVAVNGVCLTMTTIMADSFTVQVMDASIGLTNLGTLKRGDRVNLELAMRMDGRLGGHFVTGHIDGTAVLARIERGAEASTMHFDVDSGMLKAIVPRGAVALDGVSLTVADAGPGSFSVNFIPHTLASTTLGSLGVGAQVNVETDILAKYIEKLLEGRREGGIDEDFLIKHGYVR